MAEGNVGNQISGPQLSLSSRQVFAVCWPDQLHWQLIWGIGLLAAIPLLVYGK